MEPVAGGVVPVPVGAAVLKSTGSFAPVSVKTEAGAGVSAVGSGTGLPIVKK